MAPVARVPDRAFLIVLDRTRLERGQWQKAAKAVKQFIDGLLPGETVAFEVVPTSGPVTMRLDSDRERVKRRVDESMKGAAGAESAATRSTPAATGALDGIDALVRSLAGHEGPMHVVVVGGADQRRAPRPEMPEMPSPVPGPAQDGERDRTRPRVAPPREDEALPVADARLQQLADTAVSAGIVLHVLQLGARESDGAERGAFSQASTRADSPGGGLAAVAARTGGFGSAALDGGAYFARLAKELSVSYALSIATRPGDGDGKPHRLHVRVHGAKGIIVRVAGRLVISPQPGDAPAAVTVPSSAAPPASQVAGTVDPVLLDRATAYVQRFEREFTHVVAEERYVQLVSAWKGRRPLPARDRLLVWSSHEYSTGYTWRRRQLLSDFLLVQGSSATWNGYRDVAEVNGRPVRDRGERVSRLFVEAGPDSRAQLDAIAAESARHNLGVPRTINTPTFALQMLLPHLRSRFEFAAAADDPVDDVCCAVVRFEERARPTLVRSRKNEDVPLSGALWIERASGSVRRTVLETRARGTVPESTIDVAYRPVEKVGVRAPVQMWEYYRVADAPLYAGAYVEGLATYSNFRVFTVTTSETVP